MLRIFNKDKEKNYSVVKPNKNPNTNSNTNLNLIKTSPFIMGMDEYMERYGNLVRTAATWRRISFILAILCICCVAWVITTASNVKSIPFIVEVDRHGYEIAVKPVSPSGVDDRLIISRLGRFITNLKTVLNDDTAQVIYIDFVYKSVAANSAASKKVMDFYQQNNPLHISASEKVTVIVKLKSILPLGESGKTWRAEWEEQRITQGDLLSSKSFTGILEIKIVPPTRMQEILDNPLGIFVSDFNITEELQGSKRQ